jgi:hypothetical protein
MLLRGPAGPSDAGARASGVRPEPGRLKFHQRLGAVTALASMVGVPAAASAAYLNGTWGHSNWRSEMQTVAVHSGQYSNADVKAASDEQLAAAYKAVTGKSAPADPGTFDFNLRRLPSNLENRYFGPSAPVNAGAPADTGAGASPMHAGAPADTGAGAGVGAPAGSGTAPSVRVVGNRLLERLAGDVVAGGPGAGTPVIRVAPACPLTYGMAAGGSAVGGSPGVRSVASRPAALARYLARAWDVAFDNDSQSR